MEAKEKKVLKAFIEEHEKQVLGEYEPHFVESQEILDFLVIKYGQNKSFSDTSLWEIR